MISSTSIPIRILHPAVVCDRTSVSRTTLWRMVKQGAFPAPVRLSNNRIGWLETDIQSWLDAQGNKKLSNALITT